MGNFLLGGCRDKGDEFIWVIVIIIILILLCCCFN